MLREQQTPARCDCFWLLRLNGGPAGGQAAAARVAAHFVRFGRVEHIKRPNVGRDGPGGRAQNARATACCKRQSDADPSRAVRFPTRPGFPMIRGWDRWDRETLNPRPPDAQPSTLNPLSGPVRS